MANPVYTAVFVVPYMFLADILFAVAARLFNEWGEFRHLGDVCCIPFLCYIHMDQLFFQIVLIMFCVYLAVNAITYLTQTKIYLWRIEVDNSQTSQLTRWRTPEIHGGWCPGDRAVQSLQLSDWKRCYEMRIIATIDGTGKFSWRCDNVTACVRRAI